MVLKLKQNSRKLKNTKYEQTNGCDIRVEKNNRLRSGFECCCCCLFSAAAAAARYVRSMLYGNHAKAVNRRHRRAMCSVCVGRAVQCAYVAPKPKARQVFTLTGCVCSRKKTAHRAPASACCSSRQAHGGVIDVASAPCQPSAA